MNLLLLALKEPTLCAWIFGPAKVGVLHPEKVPTAHERDLWRAGQRLRAYDHAAWLAVVANYYDVALLGVPEPSEADLDRGERLLERFAKQAQRERVRAGQA